MPRRIARRIARRDEGEDAASAQADERLPAVRREREWPKGGERERGHSETPLLW